MGLFGMLNNKSKDYGKNRAVLLPKINDENIQSMEYISIELDKDDKFLKENEMDRIIKAYQFATRRLNQPHQPVTSDNSDKMMMIQLRIFLRNGSKLIMWPSDVDDDELVVSYMTNNKEYKKFLRAESIAAMLREQYEVFKG